jgi:hypothetical protein
MGEAACWLLSIVHQDDERSDAIRALGQEREIPVPFFGVDQREHFLAACIARTLVVQNYTVVQVSAGYWTV